MSQFHLTDNEIPESDSKRTDAIILAIPLFTVLLVGTLIGLVQTRSLSAAIIGAGLETIYAAISFVLAFFLSYFISGKSPKWRVWYLGSLLCSDAILVAPSGGLD